MKDLIKIDQKIVKNEKELNKVLYKLIEAKPDVKIDKNFRKELKEMIESEIFRIKEIENIKHGITRKKNIFYDFILMFGGAILASLIIIPNTLNYLPNENTNPSVLTHEEDFNISPKKVVTDNKMLEYNTKPVIPSTIDYPMIRTVSVEPINYYNNDIYTQTETLSDEEVINIVNNYFSYYGINLTGVSSPEIQRIQESYNIKVFYPYLINGENVYDKLGGKEGVEIIIDTLNKRVNSIVGLEQQN